MYERSTASALIWILAAAVAALALWRLVGPGGGAEGSPVEVKRSPGPATAERPAKRGRRIFVHVAGAVHQPGLVGVAQGSRVAEAVHRAGGPTRKAELTGVNLAATLEDGQQVLVPSRGVAAAGAASGLGSGAPGSPGTPKLGLGTATLDQLDELDGIGETLAQRIIEYRTENGGFGSLEELREVEGIGEKRFETLREALQP